MKLTSERLQVMRDNARLERLTFLEHRVRMGEDPAVAYDLVPQVDELVVLALRDELLEERGQFAEFSLARLASHSQSPEAEIHRSNADRVEFEVLREIASLVPELTVAVWKSADRLNLEGL